MSGSAPYREFQTDHAVIYSVRIPRAKLRAWFIDIRWAILSIPKP